MAIKKYTNFEEINNKVENEGQFLQAEDLFIISASEVEETEFGTCKYDVMEVSVYDINNNLLPQKSGKNVAYIKSNDIGNYMYNVTNKSGRKELAINAEKLLNDLGFTNGILKINLNFVRYRIGSENELERVWIQEISPSREEIRILPVKSKDKNLTQKVKNEFKNLNNLNKDFKYYKNSLLNSINAFEKNFLDSIDSALQSKFGTDFFVTLQKDFGVSRFSNLRKKIYEDFKISVNNYLSNKHYKISETNFGKNSEIRFSECDKYDFNSITNDIRSILFECVSYNLKSLKRRELTLKQLPKEFAIVELRKQIKDNVEAFKTPFEIKRKVYRPDRVPIRFNETITEEKPDPIVEPEPIVKKPVPQLIEVDSPPRVPVMVEEKPIQPVIEPVVIIPPPAEPVVVTPTDLGTGGGSSAEVRTVTRTNEIGEIETTTVVRRIEE